MSKAARLPDDWRPDAELLAWAKQKRPDLADCMDEVLDEFRDYWANVDGIKGKKLDWGATFRNHLRRCYRPKTAPPPPNAPRGGGRYQNTANQDWDGVVL